MLLALAAIWGASFMFIKIAVRELAPATLIVGRLGLAALTLGLLVPFAVGSHETLRQLRENAGWLIAVALINTAIPFWLLSWGETRIDSGLASIIQASVPIFNALIAFVAFREVRVTGTRLVGVAVGFVGVALLVGAQPEGKVLGALAVVGMAFCYGIGGLLTGRYLREARPIVVALASTTIATVVALPVGVAQPLPRADDVRPVRRERDRVGLKLGHEEHRTARIGLPQGLLDPFGQTIRLVRQRGNAVGEPLRSGLPDSVQREDDASDAYGVVDHALEERESLSRADDRQETRRCEPAPGQGCVLDV